MDHSWGRKNFAHVLQHRKKFFARSLLLADIKVSNKGRTIDLRPETTLVRQGEHPYNTRPNKSFKTFGEGSDCVLFYKSLVPQSLSYTYLYVGILSLRFDCVYTKIEVLKKMNILVGF